MYLKGEITMNKFKLNEKVLYRKSNSYETYTITDVRYIKLYQTFMYEIEDDKNQNLGWYQESNLKPALKITDLCEDELVEFIAKYNNYIANCNYFMSACKADCEIADIDTYLNRVWYRDHEVREYLKSLNL